MKMFVIAAVLAFAPFVHADQQQQPSQDTAAQCEAELQQGQQLSPVCQQRMTCEEQGVQSADCQAYCQANPTDAEACTAQVALNDLALDHICVGGHHSAICVGHHHRRHWHRDCRWRDRWGRCRG